MDTLSNDINDFCFFDFETRGPDDLPSVGTHRYVRTAFPIILTYAIGNGPVHCRTWEVSNGLKTIPLDLLEFYDRALDGKAWFVAWNTAFDRAVWNASYQPHAPLKPEMTLDAMCQALASNLPADLQNASVALGGPGKQADGKKLIELFSPANGGTPASHPVEWARFKSYAVRDTAVLRDVFRATRKLSRQEWAEYWANERINDRGVAVDVDFCCKADGLAQASIGWANVRMKELTGRPTIKVTTVQQIARWVYDNLSDADMRAVLEEELDEDAEEETEDEKEATPRSLAANRTLKLTRAHITRLRQLLAVKKTSKGLQPQEEKIDEVLELREYGGAASIAKFRKMATQADEGRLKNSYVFNGAMQTGRFSSRGIQVHNLPRDSLGAQEEMAIADILDMEGRPGFDGYIKGFAQRYGSVGRALSRLIRPALIAPKGQTLVWCDWSNIEARVNPWLSMSRSGDAKLTVFKRADAHPELPGVYEHTAADLLGIKPEDVTKAQRQSHGKVPELSLGFGGSEGALLRMAAAYGVAMSDEQASWMVDAWREKNPWAQHFWDQLWQAIREAVEKPGLICKAGRVSYVFVPDYLRGTLFCGLPCGRVLTYPHCKWEEREVENKKTREKYMRWQLTYGKGHGRAVLWYGKACENVTQATAGSLLRAKLRKLTEMGIEVVLHTHDDICVEVDENLANYMQDLLRTTMIKEEHWSFGLPLAAEASSHWWWTKAIE